MLERGQAQTAIEKLKTATLLLGNTNAQAFNYLGLAYHTAGQPAEAEKAYRRALFLNSNLAEARYNLGCLFLDENRLEQAKTELTAYTLRRPNSTEGWLKLGTAQWRAREIGGAEKSFGEALRLNSQCAEALNGIGLVRLKRDRATEAAQFFERALKAQPDFQPALLNLAITAQQQLNDRPLACEMYGRYLALKPPPEEAEAVRSIVSQLQPEAKASSQPLALGSATNTAIVSSTKSGNAMRASNSLRPNSTTPSVKPTTPAGLAKPSSASTVTTTAVDVVKPSPEPTTRSAQTDLSPSPPTSDNLIAGTNNVSTAEIKAPRRGLLQRLNPINLFTGGSKASPQITAPSAVAPVGTSDTSAASSTVDADNSVSSRRYSYLSPKLPSAGNRTEAKRLYALGFKAQERQRLSEAIQAYQQAIQQDPSFYDSYYNLGWAATQAGNLPMAFSAYETALVLKPESADARYNFALLLKQANFTLDAVNELQKLLSFHPDESRAHLALGNIYAQQFGQPAKARTHYVKVLETDPRSPQAAAIRDWLTQHPP